MFILACWLYLSILGCCAWKWLLDRRTLEFRPRFTAKPLSDGGVIQRAKPTSYIVPAKVDHVMAMPKRARWRTMVWEVQAPTTEGIIELLRLKDPEVLA